MVCLGQVGRDFRVIGAGFLYRGGFRAGVTEEGLRVAAQDCVACELFHFVFCRLGLLALAQLPALYASGSVFARFIFIYFHTHKTIDSIDSNRPAQQIGAANAGWRSQPSPGVTGPAWLTSALAGRARRLLVFGERQQSKPCFPRDDLRSGFAFCDRHPVHASIGWSLEFRVVSFFAGIYVGQPGGALGFADSFRPARFRQCRHFAAARFVKPAENDNASLSLSVR